MEPDRLTSPLPSKFKIERQGDQLEISWPWFSWTTPPGGKVTLMEDLEEQEHALWIARELERHLGLPAAPVAGELAGQVRDFE